ncbi:thiamine pyrophosphate-dependent enzyme [Patescibacteria group bacterium]
MEEPLLKNSGSEILLGNEAIIRGALEAGVNFVSTYPGTPASEIGNVFYKIAKDAGVYFEFSTNEKVALEASIGASFSGLKTLVAMKNFGLNVALDALFPFVYTGSKGASVIVCADDPSCHSSAQSEENSRGIALSTHIPILEPSDPQECKDFVKLGYEISEKFQIPVMVRIVTRVAHQKQKVILGKIKKSFPKAEFIKDRNKFVTLPPRVLEMKSELLEKIEKIREFSEKSEINKEQKIKTNKIGIITSGISHLNTMEALRKLGIELSVLKLGFFHPLPKNKIKNFIKPLRKVLIVEELEPFLEKEIEGLAKEVNCELEIMGKNLLPEVGELVPEVVAQAVAKITGEKAKEMPKPTKSLKRLPQLCPGCPYWLVISAIKKALQVESSESTKNVVFGGEIGCYMLFGNPPVDLQDYLSCMGSSVGIAHGIKKALHFGSNSEQKLITFVGDSSFFHSGIPPLINAVFNKSNPLIIILNNGTTAMTGQQPHPAAINMENSLDIEKIVRACGVKHVKTLDPQNQEEFIETLKEFLEKDEVSVIISKHPCKFVIPKK